MPSDLLVAKLLAYLLDNQLALSLASLRQALDRVEFVSDQERRQAQKLVAQAHLANFNYDYREIFPAINYFLSLEDWSTLENILELSLKYGLIKQVVRLMELAEIHQRPELRVPDFKEWLATHGIKWFDLYEDVEAGVAFLDEDELAGIIRRYSNWHDFWTLAWPQIEADHSLSQTRQALLREFSQNRPAVVPLPAEQVDVDAEFKHYCQDQGLTILKTLQLGVRNIKRSSHVYLVLDPDGILKIYKEILDYKRSILGAAFDSEDQVYQHLPVNDFFPRHYSQETEIISAEKGIRFLRQSVHFGQPLSDYLSASDLLSVEEVKLIVRQIAEQLNWLHDHDVLYLDLKPENVLFDGYRARLIDLGISRILQPGQDSVDIFLSDARYATPEGALTLKASRASEVFQLGVLFHQLLTGRHPFALADEPITDTSRERDLLNYSWSNAVLSYNYNLAEQFNDPQLQLIARMLAKDPSTRPTLTEVIEALKIAQPSLPIRQRRRQRINQTEDNCILFPARLGIPHRGHIEFMARLMEMGFHLVISLQRSYTITDRDPIPKWLVQKMVAQSLLARGFTEKDFTIYLTPYYNTDQEMKMHFAMLPEREQVVALASSNLGKERFGDRWLFLEQRAVFGFEGEEYFDLSWGELVRQAVKNNNYETFKEYVASGVEAICSFAELRQIYGQPPIDFVSGEVRVVLLNASGQEVVSARVGRYSTPEKTLIKQLTSAEVIDLYAKETLLRLDGALRRFKYQRTEFVAGDEYLYFLLE